jgi:hypothetical protein
VIRNPYDLLNSIYCHNFSQLKLIKPYQFFYKVNKIQKEIRINNKYNLFRFDYLKLIDLYKSYFKKVVVVKYENLNKLDFLKEIFNVDNNFVNELKKDRIINKSISKNGIKLLFFLNKFIDLKKYDNYLKKKIRPNNNLFNKILNKLLYLISIKFFLQNIFDKVIPYKKYYVKTKHIPIDIDKEIKKYNELKF